MFRDPKFQLHTTRSWDFLEEEAGIQSFQDHYQPLSTSSDVIIGMIDTGIFFILFPPNFNFFLAHSLLQCPNLGYSLVTGKMSNL